MVHHVKQLDTQCHIVIDALDFMFQLKVNEIHLRYEDDVTIPGHPFACGVTIKSVSAQSCGSNWVGYPCTCKSLRIFLCSSIHISIQLSFHLPNT